MKRWSPPSKDKPSVESKRFFAPTPDDLRTLVFDYLCHNAFTDTARVFVRDSAVKHVDSDGDEMMASDEVGRSDPLADSMEDRLAQAELRREIRINILSGRVDDAIGLLNSHFPSVLNPDPSVHSVPPSSEPQPTFKYTFFRSVDPAHLLLNLRILGFIEAARTVPLPYHHPGSKVALPPPPLPTSSSGKHPSGDSELSEQQLILLLKAQKLYSEAHSLPQASDRAVYLKELSQVTALMVTSDVMKTEMAHYLAQERREEVANQIEAAILSRTNQLAISHIELAARYTSTVWSALNDNNVSLPPQSKWPAGIKLPPSMMPTPVKPEQEARDAGTGKKSQERFNADPAPLFDLAEFLDTKSRA